MIATAGYVGLVPWAPGTVTSLLTVLVLWWVPEGPAMWGASFIVLFALGVVASDNVERKTGIADPSFVVIDEVVGMAIALLFLPKSIFLYGVAFLLFRVFDIAKPFPIDSIEKRFSGGWGIMLDDLAAGFATLMVIHLLVKPFCL